MLIASTSGLAAGANATLAGGASASLIVANTERNGLRISVDTAAANPIYLLLGAGTASATNYHLCLTASGTWDGKIGDVLWLGAVQFFSAAGNRVGVVEV
jgi:hypothetical protein